MYDPSSNTIKITVIVYNVLDRELREVIINNNIIIPGNYRFILKMTVKPANDTVSCLRLYGK
jgi:hypothetical protein